MSNMTDDHVPSKRSPLSAIAQELLSRTNKVPPVNSSLPFTDTSSSSSSSSVSPLKTPNSTTLSIPSSVAPSQGPPFFFPVTSSPTVPVPPKLNIDEAVRSLQYEILPVYNLSITSSSSSFSTTTAVDTSTKKQRIIHYYRYRRPDLQIVVKKQCDLWAYVWTSTSILSDIMVYSLSLIGTLSSSLFRITNTTVIELGCGSGLASLATVKYGRNSNENNVKNKVQVISTDLVMDALYLLTKNAQLNHLCIRHSENILQEAQQQSYHIIDATIDTNTDDNHETNTVPNTLTTLSFDWNNIEHLQRLHSMVHNLQTESVPSSDQMLDNPSLDRSSSSSSMYSLPLTILMGADILFASWTVKPLVTIVAKVFMEQYRSHYLSKIHQYLSTPQPQLQQNVKTDEAVKNFFGNILPPMTVLVDPGRTNRDDFENALQEYTFSTTDNDNSGIENYNNLLNNSYRLSLSYRRIDMHHIYTPIATMKECTIFLVYLDTIDNSDQRSLYGLLPSSSSLPAATGGITNNDKNSSGTAASFPTKESTLFQRFYGEWRKGITNIESRCFSVPSESSPMDPDTTSYNSSGTTNNQEEGNVATGGTKKTSTTTTMTGYTLPIIK